MSARAVVKPVERKELLEHIGSLATDADAVIGEARRVFLPLAQHRLALRPEIVIIAGTRGAGKTAFFRLVNELGKRVPAFFEDPSIPSATWVDAFSEERHHPPPAALDQLVRELDPNRDAALRAFWIAHLLTRLVDARVPGAIVPEVIVRARAVHAHDLGAWVAIAEQNIGIAMSALDAVDAALAAKKQFVFASYDYLDRLGLLEGSRNTRQRLVRSLVALWLSNSTRFRHLRGKIFLRPDLFEEAERSFPDASKLRPRSVSLEWDVESLYRLTIRHLANGGPHVAEMRAWLIAAGLGLDAHEGGTDFGVVPGDMPEGKQRQFAARLAGEVMGKGARKGYTHRWIPARLKDAGGMIVPRSFLRLIGYAGKSARQSVPLTGPLMEPTRLVGALQQTSRDRVNELKEEYRFVERLSNLTGATMLMDRRKVIDSLSRGADADDGFGKNGASVLDELLRIGVVEVRDDGRIDVPDIYRYGYGIKRKGGAKAPR